VQRVDRLFDRLVALKKEQDGGELDEDGEHDDDADEREDTGHQPRGLLRRDHVAKTIGGDGLGGEVHVLGEGVLAGGHVEGRPGREVDQQPGEVRREHVPVRVQHALVHHHAPLKRLGHLEPRWWAMVVVGFPLFAAPAREDPVAAKDASEGDHIDIQRFSDYVCRKQTTKRVAESCSIHHDRIMGWMAGRGWGLWPKAKMNNQRKVSSTYCTPCERL